MVSDHRLCLKEGGPTTVTEAKGGGLMEAVADGLSGMVTTVRSFRFEGGRGWVSVRAEVDSGQG
jgi:hypothetical protein